MYLSTPNTISQKEASNQGLLYYFTGKPCKHGHISYRMVKGGVCRECKNILGKKNREINKDYMKTYAKEWHKRTYTKEKRREKYIKNIESALIDRARYRARQNNIDFNIDISDIVIPEYCPVLGLKIYETPESYPSLDRKDNSKGYVKGNVFVISKRANRIKSDASITELKAIIEYMLELKPSE